jgi:hypothetical protein
VLLVELGHHVPPLGQLVGFQAQGHVAKIQVQAAAAGAARDTAKIVVVQVLTHGGEDLSGEKNSRQSGRAWVQASFASFI